MIPSSTAATRPAQAVAVSGSALRVRRIGVLMEPRPGETSEARGVFNPGAARGPDGQLYIFPRMAAVDGISRIGVARVVFDSLGDPKNVERLGMAFQPDDDIERDGASGGCEDARVTWVEPLGRYVMTYTALTAQGPRIAMAVSHDIISWKKLGLAWFEPFGGRDLNDVWNKDGVVFPVALKDPRGVPSVAMIHRPFFPGSEPASILRMPLPRLVDLSRESMWISYCPLDAVFCNRNLLCHFMSHHRLASPLAHWEQVKIGAGTPPLLTRYGFFMVYHGVAPVDHEGLEYSAGAIILGRRDGKTILYRSHEPILKPETPEELNGTVPRVVFPTGIDQRIDIGQPDRFDIYYGMADYRIGVASVELPESLLMNRLRDREDALGDGFTGGQSQGRVSESASRPLPGT
jgi:beta-1,2-mannobiose phosphorylase / 1,2-beta-oligomannan phosphorylase